MNHVGFVPCVHPPVRTSLVALTLEATRFRQNGMGVALVQTSLAGWLSATEAAAIESPNPIKVRTSIWETPVS